ncbi:hypothetical protein A3A56_03860 [Candidatus Roizmanbacteria bacterium RIFCSPLOWO2_01_FULL_40_32]|nr:MAG: hypothetical protein A3A56_03860 [Candidatus Roizmanbacteria bacterium RIFCSPLOWO2_01_FULL_40_32]
MKNKLTKGVVFALFGLMISIVLVNVAKPKTQTEIQVAPATTEQLQMEWSEVTATGVGSEEKDRIVEFVDTFERAIAQRDSDKALSFFSAPETDEEQKELDFMLWRDVDPAGKQEGSRLFRTAGYNFSQAAHYVRGVAAQEANRRVLVDEMRILHTNGEGAVGYFAQVAHLVVELRETSHGYKITQYYHENAPQNSLRKYEGFIAE